MSNIEVTEVMHRTLASIDESKNPQELLMGWKPFQHFHLAVALGAEGFQVLSKEEGSPAAFIKAPVENRVERIMAALESRAKIKGSGNVRTSEAAAPEAAPAPAEPPKRTPKVAAEAKTEEKPKRTPKVPDEAPKANGHHTGDAEVVAMLGTLLQEVQQLRKTMEGVEATLKVHAAVLDSIDKSNGALLVHQSVLLGLVSFVAQVSSGMPTEVIVPEAIKDGKAVIDLLKNSIPELKGEKQEKKGK